MADKNFITPEATLSWFDLFEPSEYGYQIELYFDKEKDEAGVKELQTRLRDFVLQEFEVASLEELPLWKQSSLPFVWPLRDGDEIADEKIASLKSERKLNETTERRANQTRGLYVFKARNKMAAPGVATLSESGDILDVTNPREMYRGARVVASVSLYAYRKREGEPKSRYGLGVGLDNVLKVSDGERLGGSAPPPSEAFASVVEQYGGKGAAENTSDASDDEKKLFG